MLRCSQFSGAVIRCEHCRDDQVTIQALGALKVIEWAVCFHNGLVLECYAWADHFLIHSQIDSVENSQ